MNRRRLITAVMTTVGVALAATYVISHHLHRGPSQGWPVYGGQLAQDHYSSLNQINRDNVKNLKVAWTFDTGETGEIQANPIVIGRVIYTLAPSPSVLALDAVTGKLLWKFKAPINGRTRSRGVSYWTDGQQSRIFVGFGFNLFALDANTGKMITSFGENGSIDLRKGLREPYQEQSITLTTPATVYKDLVIVGGEVPETHPAPPGDIRAFDARTGALRWTFHTIPHPGEPGYETWPKDAWKNAGSANNWGGMTVDAQRGILYVPTGSAVFDFYGGDRIGNDLYANSLIALDANTGKMIWYFQGVHHDLWDRDFPQPPVLLTVNRDGKKIDAVAQSTKGGFVYLFDRTNGTPLFPIKEMPFPASTVPGEKASPTQPIPTLPAPLVKQSVTADALTTRTPEAHAWAVKQFKTLISGEFVPPSVNKLTVNLPGFAGGAEWGGSAADPNTGVLYINTNNTAWLIGLTVPPPPGSPGEKIYQNQCAVCHGLNRAGTPPAVPSLRGIEGILTNPEIAAVIHTGKGRMPAFNGLSAAQVQSVVEYLTRIPQQQQQINATAGAKTPNDMPYKTMSFRRFWDPDDYPATAPPWGMLDAIDMNTGQYLWKIPFGDYPELAAKGMPTTGTDNYGGPVVTAGGLVFIGATVFDEKMHAYNSTTGQLLWEDKLPFGGLATPTTYMVNGKQYLVIACSGGQTSRKPRGGLYVAYALP